MPDSKDWFNGKGLVEEVARRCFPWRVLRHWCVKKAPTTKIRTESIIIANHTSVAAGAFTPEATVLGSKVPLSCDNVDAATRKYDSQ